MTNRKTDETGAAPREPTDLEKAGRRMDRAILRANPGYGIKRKPRTAKATGHA